MQAQAIARRWWTALALVLSFAVGAGCGDDTGPTDTAGDSGGEADVPGEAAADGDADVEPDVPGEAEAEGSADADADVAPDVPAPACEDHNGWTADVELAGSGDTLIEYRGYVGVAAPYEVLRVQIIGENVGRVRPGVYDLAGTSWEDCEVCVSILTGCASGPCERFFYPRAGTIEITAIGGVGERFAARLHGIEMVEYEILDSGIAPDPLPGGDDWCIADFAFDRTATSSHDAICGRPTVPCLDETVLDFALENCVTGELVWMTTLAAGRQALVYTMVTGWCPYCADWMTTMVGHQATYGPAGLTVAYVYGENVSAGPRPSLADCRNYATRHGANPDDFYLDHDGSYSLAATTYAMWPWTAPSDTMGLPWTTILDAETYQYVFTSEDHSRDFETVLRGLLGL